MNYAAPDLTSLTLEQLRKELLDLEALYSHEEMSLERLSSRFNDEVAPLQVVHADAQAEAWWRELERLEELAKVIPHVRRPVAGLAALTHNLAALHERILTLQAHCVPHYGYMAEDAPLQPAEVDLTGLGMCQIDVFERARPKYWISPDTAEEGTYLRALYWHQTKCCGPATLAAPQVAYLDIAPAGTLRRVPYEKLTKVGFRGLRVGLEGHNYEIHESPETLQTTFREVARFQGIKELGLVFEGFSEPIDPALLTPLRNIKSLRAVMVASDDGPLPIGALDFLAHLPELEMLSLSDALAPEAFDLLLTLPALRDLRIDTQELSLEALRQIAHLPITHLTIESVTVIPQQLIEAVRNLQHLQVLRIEGDPEIKRRVEKAVEIKVAGSEPTFRWPYDIDGLTLN